MNIEIWNLILSGLSTLMAAIAILLYIILWFREKNISSYDVFDSTYLEILKLGIEHPQFRDRAFTTKFKEKDVTERTRYGTYAFVCWNFCETIFDKGDDELMRTWSVIISTENELHRTWFEEPENSGKFKQEFKDYIRANFRFNT